MKVNKHLLNEAETKDYKLWDLMEITKLEKETAKTNRIAWPDATKIDKNSRIRRPETHKKRWLT